MAFVERFRSKETADAERRQHPRIDVSIPGRIYINGGAETYDCLLVDLSVGGAKVVLKTWRHLPESVQLLEMRDGNLFDCQVRWQNANGAGLHFVDVFSVAARQRLIDRAGGKAK